MDGRALDFVALGVLIVVVLTFIYGVIYIHDIPYEIAKKRNHPHQDAIHTAGWVSLFLMHTIWPLLWIWATVYNPEIGWGLSGKKKMAEVSESLDENTAAMAEVKSKLAELETQRSQLQRNLTSEMQELSARVFELEKKLIKNSGE